MTTTGIIQRKKRAPGYQKERGERQEARILAALEDGPATIAQLVARLPMTRKTIHHYMQRLMAQPNRRVHITSLRINGGHPAYVYDLGDKRNCTINTYYRTMIVHHLETINVPISAAAIASTLGIDYKNVLKQMAVLKKGTKIYVADWMWSCRTPCALYAAGKFENAPRPTKWPEGYDPYVKPIAPRASAFAALGL